MFTHAQTLILSVLVTLAAGHGHITNIIHNGESIAGWSIEDGWAKRSVVAIGWVTTALDEGFIDPKEYTTPDMTCHRDATNGNAHAIVAAGDEIVLQWSKDFTHKGPILDYLALCENTTCEEVDKSTLKFFKIGEEGLIDGSKGSQGYWATDKFRDNDSQWKVRIPKDLAPGNYILRSEIIALHYAWKNEAQNYPQCLNLQVTGNGTLRPKGVPAGELYNVDESGLHANIWDGMAGATYDIPGVALIDGASKVDQGTAVKATGTRAPATDKNIPTGTGGADKTTTAAAITTTNNAETIITRENVVTTTAPPAVRKTRTVTVTEVETITAKC